jgi:hypothetical protein
MDDRCAVASCGAVSGLAKRGFDVSSDRLICF